MTKGWYGNRYGHSLASKGIRTQNIQACGVKSYGEWMKGIDNEFWKYIGLGVHDMRDYMWRALYDDTLTPREAFRSFVEDNLDEFGDAGWEIMSKMDEEDEISNQSHRQIEKEYENDYELVMAEDVFDDDNEGLIYGVHWLDGDECIDASWFKTASEREKAIKEYNNYNARGERKSPTAKNINKTISKVESSASRTAEDINITKKKVGVAIDRSASRTAEEIKEARKNVGKRIEEGKSKTSAYFKKLGKRFDDSATDTAKFLNRQGKRIDDSASETAKHVKKTFEVKK